MWNFIKRLIRNIINPKIQAAEGCICKAEDYRYWSSTTNYDCPVHGAWCIPLYKDGISN